MKNQLLEVCKSAQRMLESGQADEINRNEMSNRLLKAISDEESKPDISFNQVAYVQTPDNVLNVLQQTYPRDDNGEVHIGGAALEEFEDEDKEIEQFVQSVADRTAHCDVIFHI